MQREIRQLDSSARYERETAVLTLRRADTSFVLTAFKQVFAELSHEARTAFQGRVLPGLQHDAVSAFLLKELRTGLSVQRQIERLRARAEREGVSYELDAAYEALEDDKRWLDWIIRAGENLAYVPTYDELLQIMSEFDGSGFPVSAFGGELYRRDPNRAEADFYALLSSSDPNLIRRGVSAWRGTGAAPSGRAIEALPATADERLELEASQLIYAVGRNGLDMLLPLISNPSPRYRSAAEYRMRVLGHLTEEEAKTIVATATSAQERREAWRRWWADHENDSDAVLRDRAVQILIEKSRGGLTAEIVRQLGRYREHRDVYPALLAASSSSDDQVRRAAIGELSQLAFQGHQGAVDAVVEFCRQASPETLASLSGYVARLDDARLGPIFLKAVRAQPGEDTPWKRQVARVIGEGGRAWALEPLLYLIIEEGCGNATVSFTKVEGAEKATPRLLEALLQEADRNKRHAIRSAIEAAGGERLGQRLTAALAHTPESGQFQGGIRYEILELMQRFPDPNATPQLHGLLTSDNPWDQLGAARVLGTLGDSSGAGPLIARLRNPTTRIAWHYFNHDIGAALQSIGAADTRQRLETVYKEGTLEVRKCVLGVMAQQQDPAYLSFMGERLATPDAETRKATVREMGRLVALCTQGESDLKTNLGEEDMALLRRMFLWAFFGEKIMPDDPSFPNHGGLASLQGAVARVNRWQSVEFTASNRVIRLFRPPAGELLVAADGTRAGRDQPTAAGNIERRIAGDYMVLFLHLNYGGAAYLFKRQGAAWQPIGCTGGVIE